MQRVETEIKDIE